MDEELSLRELTERVKLGIMIDYVPGFAEATFSYMAGITTNCRKYNEERLGRMVLGRDPVTSDDIEYSEGRITGIGSTKVIEWDDLSGMPTKLENGTRVEYGIFSIPVRLSR